MTKRIAREKHLWFIQVFDNGKNNISTRQYKIKSFIVADGLIDLIDPKTHLTKTIPINDCTIDEVKE